MEGKSWDHVSGLVDRKIGFDKDFWDEAKYQ